MSDPLVPDHRAPGVQYWFEEMNRLVRRLDKALPPHTDRPALPRNMEHLIFAPILNAMLDKLDEIKRHQNVLDSKIEGLEHNVNNIPEDYASDFRADLECIRQDHQSLEARVDNLESEE